MKGLAILGSPRKGGNSEILLDAFLAGAREEGGEAEIVRVNDLLFRPCQNCGGCARTGQCVLRDDLTPVYERIENAAWLAVCSPIYFYGVSAQTKMFIDRMQAYWSRKHLLGDPRLNDPARRRPGVFLSVAATSGPRIFSGAVLEVRYGMEAMGFAYSGEVLVRGVDSRGAMEKRPEELAAAARLGAALVRGELAAVE
ncbi:MAG: flavodoxin family protein [Thermodesulfobacteriota bacterium]